MAGPNGDFFIGEKLQSTAPHHESFKQLWETKWKKPCEMGVYPFMFGTIKDFQPVVDKLIEGDFKEPYDWDSYARVFFPEAEGLVSQADAAKSEGNNEKASELYLRASALYRIARFPLPRAPAQHSAWTSGKRAALSGLSLHPTHPIAEVQIPHPHALPHEGRLIPAYHLLPTSATPSSPSPLLIILTGLDGYRTDLAVWAQPLRSTASLATLILEIPGTGDCPAASADPTSPDRWLTSILDWVRAQRSIDAARVALWGFSTGGYYAIRGAHTHAERLAGAVAVGGGAHYMFDPRWLDRVNALEYPFDLATTLCAKFGYGDDFARFREEAQGKFSLLNDGTLDSKSCTRLLLVNGTEDEIFPIDDCYLCLLRGAPKEARFVDGVKHMGEPESFSIVLEWLAGVLGLEFAAQDVLRQIPFKPKY